MIKRIWNFDKQDWKHVSFLFGNMVKQFCKGEFTEAKDAFYFMKLHFTHDSKRIK